MFLSSHTAEFKCLAHKFHFYDIPIHSEPEGLCNNLTFLLDLSCPFQTFYLLGSILILLATLSLMLHIKHLAISPCLSSVCKSLASILTVI